MLKKSVDNLSIIGFIVLMFMLLVSALALYLHKYGFSLQTLYMHYAGDSQNYINPKSFSGILKSFSPHILVMPLSFFILFHIGLASKSFKQEHIKYIAMIGFGSSVADVLINFFIALSPIVAGLKVITLITFELSMLYVMILIYKKIYRLK